MEGLLVLGLDLSLTATGLAAPDGHLYTIKTRPSDKDRRLVQIKQSLETHLLHDVPRLAVIEDLPIHASASGITGMVHGVARVLLMEHGVPYVLVPPATLKVFATGRGNAPKPDMRMALYKRGGLDVADDNQVDAWWLRELGHHLIDQPMVSLPQTHLRALDKIERK